jgi:hypothetical protein
MAVTTAVAIHPSRGRPERIDGDVLNYGVGGFRLDCSSGTDFKLQQPAGSPRTKPRTEVVAFLRDGSIPPAVERLDARVALGA